MLSAEQRAALSYVDGNAYVGAGPGTGKTFLLVERVRTLRGIGVTAERILVLTFSRRAAAELRDRLLAAGVSGGIDVRTFHGFAARVAGGGLARFRDIRLLDGFSSRLLLEAAIARTPTPTLGAAARRSRSFADDAKRVLDDLGRAGAEAVAGIETDASPRLRDLLAIRTRLVRAHRAIGAGDLGDLVSRALAEASRPGSPAQAWLSGRYADVLVDEFQDTDREQLALLELLGARVFAVGDEAQSIYRFRGASDAIVPYALARFAMRRFDLTLSRRCPPAVCALAAEAPLPVAVPLRSARPDGPPVDMIRYGGLDDEARALAGLIEAELDAGREAREIAVLLRAFRPLGPMLCAELARCGIPVVSSGSDALFADARVATLGAALALFAAPADPSRWTDLLASPPLGCDALALRVGERARAALRLDATLAERLTPLLSGDADAARRLADGLLGAYEAWTAGDLGLAARRVARRLGLLAAVVRDAPPADVRAQAARLKAVCDALAAAQRTARALGEAAEPQAIAARFDDLLAAIGDSEAGTGAPGVRVLTVHAAKGLEFERVFIGDAVHGRFPRESRASQLFDDCDRALLAAHGVDGASVAPEGAATEEASLWYVAVTRCSERLTVTFAERGINDDPQRPSSFIAARAPKELTAVDRSSLLVRALGSGDEPLRAWLIGAGATDGVPALAAFACEGAAAFTRCETTPLRRTRPFSVSEATEWLRCPRGVYYSRLLRLPQDDSAAQHIGGVLHRVLQRFHAAHETFGGTAGPLEAWIAELLALRREEWDPAVFAGPAVEAAAARAADVALKAYAPALSAYARSHPFRVEQREAKVSIPAGAFALEGRLDRVDRLADGTRIVVDYKRGAAKPPAEKAAQKLLERWQEDDAAGIPRRSLIGDLPEHLDLQLAFYATALEQVGTLAKIYLGGAHATEQRSGVAVVDAVPFEGPLREVARAALAELEREVLAPLAAGTLTYVPTAGATKACEYCTFATVCPGPAQTR